MAIIDAKIAEICLTQDQFGITEQNEGESLIRFIGGCGGGEGHVPSAPFSVNFFSSSCSFGENWPNKNAFQ